MHPLNDKNNSQIERNPKMFSKIIFSTPKSYNITNLDRLFFYYQSIAV